MFFRFKKNKNKHSSPQNDRQQSYARQEETPPADVSAAHEDQREDETAVPVRQFWNSGASTADWIGEMYNDELKKGTFDALPGKGKPFEVPSGDITNSILKNANVLPDWLTLQHEIRDQLHRLIESSNRHDDRAIGRELEDINQKVKKYNSMVPSVVLQKRKITKEEMRRQYELWI